MKTYEYEVRIVETHIIYVDADTEEEAARIACDEAKSNTPDFLEISPNLISVEETE